jgi:cytoskeletal protein RodZ
METKQIWMAISIISFIVLVVSIIGSGASSNNSNDTVKEPVTVPTPTETPKQTTNSEEITVQTALLIDTYPEGATVVLNGENIGETPIRVECGPGTYELRLHLDGYEDIPQETVTAEEGKETQLEYTLKEEAVTDQPTNEETKKEETTNDKPTTVDISTDQTPVCTPNEPPVSTVTPTECIEGAIPTSTTTLKLDKVVSIKPVKCLEFQTPKKCSIVTINGKEYYLAEK